MHSTWAVENANLKKIQSRPGSNLPFQLLKLKSFKNCKPFMATSVTSGSSHVIYFICIHLQKNWISLAIGTVSSSEVQMSERVWAEVNYSFNRRDSLELLHCLILHYCLVHLVLLNSNYIFFSLTLKKNGPECLSFELNFLYRLQAKDKKSYNCKSFNLFGLP